MFIPQEFIRKKRDNIPLNDNEIQEFILGVTDGSINNEHISAFSMAVFFNSMSIEEMVSLTKAMRDSGNTLEWHNLNGPIVDKHSTGGVGDVVSLMLGPMLAACGAYIPMISGRGLGHTGGTLDKFESIPNYNVTPSNELFKKVVKECGVAIIGQTSDLAPADKRIYSIRDITATVESIAMISSSILSKKLAEGLDALIMDVKVGNGAFMPTYEKSKKLAQTIVNIANNTGVNCQAILTDMEQPLISSAGNAVEVIVAIEYLMNKNINPRLHKINMELCSTALVISGLATDNNEARQKLEEALSSGKALEIFAKMISMLGGPHDFIEKYNTYLNKAPIIKPIYPEKNGIISNIKTYEIGMTIVGLGGGRVKPQDSIDHSVGLTDIVHLGQKIDPQTPLALIHAKNENDFNLAKNKILNAITIDDNTPNVTEIYETISYTK